MCRRLSTDYRPTVGRLSTDVSTDVSVGSDSLPLPHNSYQYVCVIISIQRSEIFAEYECHNGFENRVTFSLGNQVFNGRDRCLPVLDS